MPRNGKVFFTALVCVALIAGCSNVKNKKITEQNKDKILDEIKNSRDLSVEEVGLLQAYMIRQSVKDAFPGDKDSSLLPVGKTIGQVIEEQRRWAADESERERQDKERRAKAEAIAEQQRKALRVALRVTIYEKGFTSVDLQDYITMKFAYENHTDKQIRGFKGEIEFDNLFGDKIKTSTLAEDEPLAAGQTRRVSKTLNYNQFMEQDKKLRSTELSNLKIIWKPSQILFADGTSMKIDEADE